MDKHLFIGGCVDGEWRNVDARRYEVRVHDKTHWSPHAKMNTIEGTFIEQSYRREVFREGEKEYVVFVSGIQPGKILETLLAGYPHGTIRRTEEMGEKMSECEHHYTFIGVVYSAGAQRPGSGAHDLVYEDKFFCEKCLTTRFMNSRSIGNTYSAPVTGTFPK